MSSAQPDPEMEVCICEFDYERMVVRIPPDCPTHGAQPVLRKQFEKPMDVPPAPMSEPVKPAMSEYAWSYWHEQSEEWRSTVLMYAAGEVNDMGNMSRHALAARCLDGQPFGFRWEDVERERATARYLHMKAQLSSGEAAKNFRIEADHHTSIADRIEALLRPRAGE